MFLIFFICYCFDDVASSILNDLQLMRVSSGFTPELRMMMMGPYGKGAGKSGLICFANVVSLDVFFQ